MTLKWADDIRPYMDQLQELLLATVEDGASIGFHHPVAPATAQNYWQGVHRETVVGKRKVLIALEKEQLAGCVQLAFPDKDNARHRVEVEKLMVHPCARGEGFGGKLMVALEQAALAANRTLIVLDTRTGDFAETLYSRLGYRLAGKIPNFTLEADGSHGGTSIFYKNLTRRDKT